jgi:hypothetical protein
MRLPDFTDDAGLIALRRSMGAEAPGSFSPSYQPANLTWKELEQLATEGKDVWINDVVVLDDGTLSYKESRVLIYIRDISPFRNWIPRFHIADCETLQQMKQRNAFDRYVVATRDDGSFVVNMIGKGGQVTRKTRQLNVCQNCLYKLAFDGFSRDFSGQRRRMMVSQFTIRRFFEKFPKSLFSQSVPLILPRPRPSTITQRILRSFQNVSGHGAAGLANAVIGASPFYQIGSFFMYIIKMEGRTTAAT